MSANPNPLMSPKYLCRLLFDILPLLIADGGALAAQHLPRPGGTVQEYLLRHKKPGKQDIKLIDRLNYTKFRRKTKN